jgi:hypothetical protein
MPTVMMGSISIQICRQPSPTFTRCSSSSLASAAFPHGMVSASGRVSQASRVWLGGSWCRVQWVLTFPVQRPIPMGVCGFAAASNSDNWVLGTVNIGWSSSSTCTYFEGWTGTPHCLASVATVGRGVAIPMGVSAHICSDGAIISMTSYTVQHLFLIN